MPHCPARRPLDGSPCSLDADEPHPDGHITYSDPARRLGITAVWSDPHPFESLPADDEAHGEAVNAANRENREEREWREAHGLDT